MRNQTTISYLILLVLTTLTAIIASNKVLIVAVILTAIVKFWLVAFQFMELKKAHTFWKFSILLFGTLMGLFYFDTIYNMTYTKPLHTFHIPVMGLAFTIDSPLRVAHYGIDSVISIMDDEFN